MAYLITCLQFRILEFYLNCMFCITLCNMCVSFQELQFPMPATKWQKGPSDGWQKSPLDVEGSDSK